MKPTITLEITGQIKSGKNHMQIARNGRHFPLPAWAAWRDIVLYQLKPQWKKQGGIIFNAPIRLRVLYWRGDERRRDIPGMADALFHCLERLGIVKDDALVQHMSWHGMGLDRKAPRAVLRVSAI